MKQLEEKIKAIIKKIKGIEVNKEKIKTVAIVLLVPLLIYTIMCLLTESIGIEELENIDNKKFLLLAKFIRKSFIDSSAKLILNYLLILAIFLISKGITGKTKNASIITICLCFAFEIINYIVTQVRGISVTISDIYSISTAIGVAKGIKLELNINFYISIILFIVAILLACCIKNKEKEKKTKRIVNSIVGIVIIIVIMHLPYLNEIGIWDINDSYKNYGSGLTILRMAKDLRIDKPKGYNKQSVKELLNSYEEQDEKESDVNVVVIMNESFADLNQIYNLPIKEDNIPFFHSLQNETKIGIMHSSQYGGGTANVEYEFLTQNTTAFLPVGSMPYQQYIKKKTNSIVSYMNKLNYTTNGIHSWYKKGYSRGKIYNHFGFDNTKFKEDMPNLNNEFSGYPSDLSTYEQVINEFENKQNDEKIFSFVLTIQNHLPYVYHDENAIQYVENDEDLNNYLQIEHKSDEALENFINYLKNSNEKTIVLFFGDHQTNLNFNEKYDIRDGYSENEAAYVVPFFIWTNYECNLEYPNETSTNYLQSILIENIGLPKDSYTQYITELRKTIPVITTQYYIDKDGNQYKIDDSSSPYYDKVKEYENVVYYKIFNE